MIRRGMTLVEMLVALVATLTLMAAIAQAFSAFGNAVSGSRAVLELDSRMRAVAWRLRSDLAGATARPVPPLNPASGEGYLEIIEGPATDSVDNAGVSVHGQPVSGDHDDVLLLTTRSTDTPFIGRAPGSGGAIDATFESSLAEVGWFARPTPNATNPVTYTLYRKQLLVMGYVGAPPFNAGSNSLPWNTYGSTWSGYFEAPCDVSVRREGGILFPNSLADLTNREARFLHNPQGLTGLAAFPAVFVGGTHQALMAPDGLIFETPQRQGEDVVLNNVLAFDVRVFDPTTPVWVTPGNTALVAKDDVDLDDNVNTQDLVVLSGGTYASGGYVDLGSGTTNLLLSGVAPHFMGACQPRSGLDLLVPLLRVYDTWSLGYEADGLDQDGDGTADEGTNGLDDDGDSTFDEPAADSNSDGIFEDPGGPASGLEGPETLPPYPHPLRGIEVRIRCYEPSSRQVRQVTIRHTFVPH